jgi:hypothetical protein
MSKRILLFGAAVLVLLAIFLPLWGMALVSVQYPEGLRMVVYPMWIRGDITELNLLNHYIGMAEISDDYFSELRVIPALFAAISLALVVAALVRRTWALLLPLGLMGGAAVYGFWSMTYRLHQFGTDLDPMAAMKIEPFVPPMLGSNTIAQFATYSYFSWGTALPMLAGLIVAYVLWLDLRDRRWREQGGAELRQGAHRVGGGAERRWQLGMAGVRGGRG